MSKSKILRIYSLQKGENVKGNSHIYKLNPVLDDGVLRVGGRLSKAAMPGESKHPVILAKDLHISDLILRHIHQQIGYAGRNHMLSKLRQCGKCGDKKNPGSPGHQQMADLPLDRVSPDEPPFTHVEFNYFGPIQVKRGRSLVKKYGAIKQSKDGTDQ